VRRPRGRHGYDRRVARRRIWAPSLVAGILVVLAVFGIMLLIPSNHYIFLPDPAQPAAEVVRVPNDRNEEDTGGIYFLEVFIRKANLFERLFPWIHKGASLVPARQYNPENLSFEERRRISLDEMSESQKVAVAVGLRALGYDVTQNGARVASVTDGYPADGVIELGDRIVEARGKPVARRDDLFAAMQGATPGEAVDMTVVRRGRRLDLHLRTRASRNDRTRAVVGVTVEQSFHYPVDVRITTRNIGGPSAGLAFALDVVDELGPDVDKGRKVAVTGALELDGKVDPIGGIKQKTFGAREAGADVFLVPDENAPEARRWADGLKIVPVSTFDEALSYLKTSS
jgi:PDZ domain-containing protein